MVTRLIECGATGAGSGGIGAAPAAAAIVERRGRGRSRRVADDEGGRGSVVSRLHENRHTLNAREARGIVRLACGDVTFARACACMRARTSPARRPPRGAVSLPTAIMPSQCPCHTAHAAWHAAPGAAPPEDNQCCAARQQPTLCLGESDRAFGPPCTPTAIKSGQGQGWGCGLLSWLFLTRYHSHAVHSTR
jgi:hypothetical protein